MTKRKSYLIFLALFVVVVIILVFLIYQYSVVQQRIIAHEQRRNQSYLLAFEFINVSHSLTQMARSYVTTGDVSFKKKYFKILKRKMSEIPQLQSANKRLDDLALLESKAFAAMDGHFVSSIEQESKSRPPGEAYALKLLYSDAYVKQKSRISVFVAEYLKQVDKQTNSIVSSYTATLQSMQWLVVFWAMVAVLFVIYRLVFSYRRVLRPILHLQQTLKNFRAGNTGARADISMLYDLALIGHHCNKLADALEVEIVRKRHIGDALKDSYNIIQESVISETNVHDGQLELLHQEKQRLEKILYGTHFSKWEWNIQTGQALVDERWAQMVGYSLFELKPITIDTWKKLVHPEDWKKVSLLLERHFQKKQDVFECEMRMRHKDGHWVWVRDKGTVTKWSKDATPLSISGTHIDISMDKVEEERVRYLATHDALTDLPNIQLARDRLSMAMSLSQRNGKSVAVLHIDLDRFKDVNAALGHDVGDEMIRVIANRIRSIVRGADTVARVGGDEFLAIMSDVSSIDSPHQVARKILQQLCEPILHNDISTQIGASVGIAFCPEDSDDIDQLIQIADNAMYIKKKSTIFDRSISA